MAFSCLQRLHFCHSGLCSGKMVPLAFGYTPNGLFLIIKGSAILGKVNMRTMRDDTHLTGRWASYQYRKVAAGTAAAFSCVTHAAASDERNPQNASRFFFLPLLTLTDFHLQKSTAPFILDAFQCSPFTSFYSRELPHFTWLNLALF